MTHALDPAAFDLTNCPPVPPAMYDVVAALVASGQLPEARFNELLADTAFAEWIIARENARQRNVLETPKKAVMQPWLLELPFMQQTVLLTAIRGPDNTPKYGPVKMLMRWYRRCILLSAMDGRALTDPRDNNGGSFTGPSLPADTLGDWEPNMDELVSDYLRTVDALPHHFHLHFMHAAEIVGYKHPDPRIAQWWRGVYVRFARDMHLQPEPQADMDERLGDNRAKWLKHADPATVA